MIWFLLWLHYFTHLIIYFPLITEYDKITFCLKYLARLVNGRSYILNAKVYLSHTHITNISIILFSFCFFFFFIIIFFLVVLVAWEWRIWNMEYRGIWTRVCLCVMQLGNDTLDLNQICIHIWMVYRTWFLGLGWDEVKTRA